MGVSSLPLPTAAAWASPCARGQGQAAGAQCYFAGLCDITAAAKAGRQTSGGSLLPVLCR